MSSTKSIILSVCFVESRHAYVLQLRGFFDVLTLRGLQLEGRRFGGFTGCKLKQGLLKDHHATSGTSQKGGQIADVQVTLTR